ncbi:NEAT domain-containing protein [Clostridium sp. B9]|uniref:NEAT domain-containing protein n=1 Tax=Clostridium sp. B9 TaxID=3423224 RepID=UPI003D2EB79D
MGRKKINKILGYALVTSMLLGGITDTIYAATRGDETDNIAIVQNDGLSNGIYEVKNITSYIEPGNETGENMARNAIKEQSRFRVDNGKTTMTVYFNPSLYGFMNGFEVSVGESKLPVTENKEEKSITFEVPSPNTKVKIGLNISIMGRKVELFLANDMSTVTLIDGAPVINNAKDIVVTEGDPIDLLDGITSTDNEEGNLSVEVKGDTSFIENGKAIKAGVYPITYRVTDSKGQFDEKNVKVEVNKKVSLADGNYILKNEVKYVGQGNAETGNSMARKVLAKDSKIDIKNGENIVTLIFNKEMYEYLKDFEVSVDGSKVNTEINKEERTLKFNIPNLNSNINVSMLVSMMGKRVSFNTILDYDTAKLIDMGTEGNGGSNGNEETGGNNENNGDENIGNGNETGGNEESNNNGNTSEGGSNGNGSVDENNDGIIDNSSLKDGIYNIENSVLYIGNGNQETGNDMARKALAKESKLEVKDNKKILTLKFNEEQFSFFKDFRVTVNGKDVVVTPNEANRTMTFEIPSLDSEIIVTALVTVMGRDVSFKTILKKDTLELVSEGAKPEIDKPDTNNPSTDGNNSSNSGNNGNESTSGNNNAGISTNQENQVKKGKLYTIENKVSHESQTGVDMARKYLNKISDLEVIDGKNYLTLTFTGQKFMKDHKIIVNGKNANYRVVSKDGDTIKLRFEIPNLDADMKVSLYVVPMGRNVEFDVELLKNTKKFVKDFTVSSLPQTGGLLGGNSVALLGMTLMGASTLIRKKED